MSSQDGYDWPNGCQDEQWPTGAEPDSLEAANDRLLEPLVRAVERWGYSAVSDPAYQQEQRERNAKWLRDMLDSSKYP